MTLAPPQLHDFDFTAMGSPGRIRLFAATADQANGAAAAMMDEIARIEARYSRFNPDSVLSRVNAIARSGGTVTLDSETAELLDYAFTCHRKSGGLFDVTAGCLHRAWDFSLPHPPEPRGLDTLLPRIGLDKLLWQPPVLTFPVPGMELDFGGIGKEYAVDRAAEIGLDHGLVHGLIDLGGDIRVTGPQADGTPWPIGIRHPRDSNALAACLSLAGGAVATSGDYERFVEINGKRHCHIFDPRTGWPVQGLSAVTVLAESCLVAGSVATIAMLKGKAGTTWLTGLGQPCLWFDGDGRQGCHALPVDRPTPAD